MSTTQNSTTIDRTKLRLGAAVGVLVVTAGFGLGVVMHTTSSASRV